MQRVPGEDHVARWEQRREQLRTFITRVIDVPHVMAVPSVLPFLGVANHMREVSFVFPAKSIGITIQRTGGPASKKGSAVAAAAGTGFPAVVEVVRANPWLLSVLDTDRASGEAALFAPGADASSALQRKGVVLNEMKGAMAPPRCWTQTMAHLWPRAGYSLAFPWCACLAAPRPPAPSAHTHHPPAVLE